MSIYKDDIRDDEIRIIGSQSRKTLLEEERISHEDYSTLKAAPELPPEPSGRKKKSIWPTLLALLLLLGLVIFFLWHQKPVEDPYDGVFEQKIETPIQPVGLEKKILGQETDSLLCYTERIDTVINDVLLTIFIPHNATPELIVGKPDDNDPSIILAAQAADIRADNKQILGAFVNKGTPLAWGLSKKGYCAIIDGQMTIGTSENSPLFEQATETEGYFFRQFPLVDQGVLVENEQKNKSVRKALCTRLGQYFIAVTESDESYHDFSQALIDLGVEDAISLVGSKYAFGWWIDSEGVKTSFAEGWHQYRMENYVVWRRSDFYL